MKNIAKDSKLLKEFAKKYSQTARPFTKEEVESKEPMTEEDYRFERACETIFHM